MPVSSTASRTQPAIPSATLGLVGLHLGFLLTGVYTALVGAALPLIAAHWRLLDDRSGALFLAQFLGAMAGALVRARSLLRLIALGFLLVGLMCAGLAYVPGAAALPLLFLYGVGLGIAMTSTSVWMHAHFAYSGSALESLNAIWAVGAGLAPWLVLPWVHPSTLGRFLLLAGLPAVVFAAWLLAWSPSGSRIPERLRSATTSDALRPGAWFAIALAVLSFGAVGVESAIGGWMTTYVARAGQLGVLSVSSAASGFWLGLLGSRVLATWLLLGALSIARLMWLALALAVVSVAVLLSAHTPWLLLLCATACGAGIGPVYPMVLAVAMRFFRGRWMFVAAGVGAASVPWGTGLLSRAAGSLRTGLVLPLGVLLLMAVAMGAGRRWWGEETSRRTPARPQRSGAGRG